MNNLLAYIKYIIKLLIRNCTRIFFFFPIKNTRVLFIDDNGKKMVDNPKYIYDFLKDHYPNQFEYIWIYNEERGTYDLSPKTKVVKRQSLKWIYYMATSKVIVDDWPPSLLIPPRKGQLYLETWHAGGAYKKIGYAHTETNVESITLKKRINTVKIFISSSVGFTKGNIEGGYHYNGEILNSGMPRNDIFFHHKSVLSSANKVKKYYSLHGNIILYAPTFRGEVNKIEALKNLIDVNQLREALKNKSDEDINILVRLHYLDKYNYPFGAGVIDVNDYPNMQELLCAADILITDYSSSMWDYALLGRPCLLYTPDIDQYIKDRGFFTPPEQWPGIICRNMNELCDEIRNLDKEACAERAKRHLELMGSYEAGYATEIISNRIIKYMNGE